MKIYVVDWVHAGKWHMLDFTTEVDAYACAVMLGEAARTKVKVTTAEKDFDPEIEARIWDRIQRAIEEDAWKPLLTT